MERYNELGRKLAAAAGDEWRALPVQAGLVKIRDCLRALELSATEHEAEIAHGLAMFAAQADERIRLGVEDPLRWLYAAWSPKVLIQRMQLPNEQAARRSVRPDSGQGSEQQTKANADRGRARREAEHRAQLAWNTVEDWLAEIPPDSERWREVFDPATQHVIAQLGWPQIAAKGAAARSDFCRTYLETIR